MPYKERVVRAGRTSDHIVQLFDSPESLAKTVSDYVLEGLRAGENALVVIAPERWTLVSRRIAPHLPPTSVIQYERPDTNGVGPITGRAGTRLIVLDAAQTLGQLLDQNGPAPDRFEAVIGRRIRAATRRGHRLRVYGEMVDLLAARAELKWAYRLEQSWNALAEHLSFRVLCGYSAVHFGDSRTAAALALICGAHTHVRAASSDDLGAWLLDGAIADGPRRTREPSPPAIS
jgi:DcmR-like sensory protein